MANEKLTNLIDNLKDIGVLKTSAIINAFLKIDRADFVPENLKDMAYIDEALPIGERQTISQPYTVAFMLELLEPQSGDKILDIGAGSGWQTAILASIVGNPPARFAEASARRAGGGKVFAIELLPKICEFGKANVKKYNFIEKGIVEWFCQDASNGLPKIAEKVKGFDKIVAAAAFLESENPEKSLPDAWKSQLKIGGRIVVPIGNSIWLFIKKTESDFKAKEYHGFAFVPFVKG